MPKILWVEDQPETIHPVMDELAEEPGYEFDLVTNAEDALNKIEANSYSAIIVDLSVPATASDDAIASADNQPAAFNGLIVIDRCLADSRETGHSRSSPAIIIYSGHAEGYFRQIADRRYRSLPFLQKARMLMQPTIAANQLKDAIAKAQAIPTGPKATRSEPEIRSAANADEPSPAISLEKMIIHDLRVPLGYSIPLAKSVETQLKILAGVPAEHAASNPYSLRQNIEAFVSRAEYLIDEVVDADSRSVPACLDELTQIVESLKDLPSPASATTSMLVDKLSAIAEIGQQAEHPALVQLAIEAIRLQIGASIEDVQALRRNLLRALDISFGAEKRSAVDRAVDSSDVLMNVINRARAVALDRGIEFKLNVMPMLIVSHASDEALETVFANLIDNAVKYNGQLPDRNAWIKVTHQRMSSGTIVTDIETWGPNLSDEEIASLRGENTTANYRIRRAIGTGLGLEIVRAELQKVNGTLKIIPHRRGRRNEILTFRVTIPVAPRPLQISP